jgi:ABC-type transport system involved in cytochrome c biogenesis ATPase subunit
VTQSVLETHDLSRSYGRRRAVDGLDLEVRPGEIFGFLGANGAGKTPTRRIALGLVRPTAGHVRILGEDVATARARVLPRLRALIEAPALYGYLSGRANLQAFGAVLGGVPKQRLDAVLDLVQLSDRQRDRVRSYSFSMRQRLGVWATGWGSNARLEDRTLVTPSPTGRGRDLVRFLAEGGRYPDRVAERAPTLEQIFLDLTGASDEVAT